MRKILLFAAVSLACLTLVAQHRELKLPEEYFRSSPFDKKFSAFVSHLMNDPTLNGKTVQKKTDSTLFFLEGNYSTHQPFFFKPIRTRIILSEKEESFVVDSVAYYITVFHYQLIGYAPPGEDGMKDVIAEFEKCSRKYKKDFSSVDTKELKNQDTVTGAVRDFSFKLLPYFPMTLSWATSKDRSTSLFAITIRFEVRDNIAYVIKAPPGSEEEH